MTETRTRPRPYMHGFHDFPYEGCDMADIGPHEGTHFDAGLEHGRIRRAAGQSR